MKKRLTALLLAVVMVLSMATTAGAAETISSTGSVTSLRLERADGTASVKNASGKALTLWNGMRLYNGYTVSTESSSYAYISLDSTKAVKLDASSSGEVMQSGSLLEMKLVSGSMFFDVTAPVKSNEKMTIRTTTMVTGVRGTAGWVEIVDRYTTRITLLEGELEIFNINPLTGRTRKVALTGGQTATIVFQGKENDYLTNIVPEEETIQDLIEAGVIQDENIILNDVGMTVEELQEKDVPGFVAVEVAKDPVLQQ